MPDDTVLVDYCVAAPCSSALAASTSDEITQREIDNAALAREAAGQGMVLLENENHTLPLKTKKLALFGSGAVRTIKGGFGSGDPFNGGLSGGGSWDVDLNEHPQNRRNCRTGNRRS